jgi:uncharacterized protein
MSLHIDSDGIELRSYLAMPADFSGARGLVLCHGFPQAPREAASAGLRYAELADRIVSRVDMAVMTLNFRGTGQSEGDFSLGGWLTDLKAAVRDMRTQHGIEEVWLAGFGAGGSLALYLAGVDAEIRGVATFSARAHFDDWADNGPELLIHCRRFGMIKNDGFPADPEAWADELRTVRPLDVVDRIPPRPVMIVHGADDDRVPVQDARDLADRIGETVDLRIIHGADHRLRHDPRIVALLLGWLDDQR